MEAIGGIPCLLGLVAMAVDSQGVYAALKALVSAQRSNPVIATQMIAMRTNQVDRLLPSSIILQTLAILLEEKATLLNSHILHLIFALVGTLDSSRDATLIPNVGAFEDLLCDLDVWMNATEEVNRLLFEHVYELITEST
jgi:hypothetical protein